MPYPNIPSDTKEGKDKTARMDRCVEKVIAQGHTKDSAIAICYNSIVNGSAAFPGWSSDGSIDAGVTWVPYTGAGPEVLIPFFIPAVLEGRDADQQSAEPKSAIQWSAPTADDVAQAHTFFGAEDSGELLKFSGAVLAKARRNLNGDAVDEQGLKELAATLPLKAVDDEHDEQRVVGFFVNARVQDAALLTDGILFARRFPDIAADVQAGKKKLSVEAFANRAVCSECGQAFLSPQEYCAHLLGRPRNGATRLLSGMTAVGGATVLKPAEPDAVFADRNGFLMIASLSEDNPDDSEGCDEPNKGDDGAMDENAEVTRLQSELAAKIAELEAAVQKLQATESENAGLKAQLEQANTDHAAQIEATTLRASRSLELIEAGFTRVEIEGLADRLAGIDAAVYDLLKTERAKLKAGAGNQMQAAQPDDKPKTGNPVLGGGTPAPAPDEWAVFDRMGKED